MECSILPDISVRMSQKDSESEAGKQPGYVLRENPKKTRRFADSSGGVLLKELHVCKECGKGFQSLKALCGHMASHSDKEKLVISHKFEQYLGTNEKPKLIMDSHSDTETSAPRKKRVSKRIRYKNLDVYSYMGNGCSSVPGIEQEQQEVAISLMLLSRDSGHKGGLNSVGESSDNNSVVLEAKSSSIDMMISGKKVLSSVTNLDEVVGAKKASAGELKSSKYVSASENSDSGYFRNGPKKIESDVSVDGFLRNGGFKKLEVESGSGFGRNLLDEDAKDQVERGSSKYELRKRTRNGLYRPESLMGAFKNEANWFSNDEILKTNGQKSKYECLTCKKTFHSHRALGGHRANHSKINGCCESICESGENSIEMANSPIPIANDKKLIENDTGKTPVKEDVSERKPVSKKSKGHECPICFRVFKSGQALGGHKRSHFVGGREANTMVIRQERLEPEPEPVAEVTVLFDLNLPATEEDPNEDVGFVAW
ncbi:uncharacterized protein LOC133822887 [Humulus lupulus]|uniref:uncharacterized protein LOC133822887 n=1 Tax=Humulus lupulus TaxID=3486 RepID=UPI002B40A141|nr:uncharacterized protein LOC133822887 [Humulus lupulus]